MTTTARSLLDFSKGIPILTSQVQPSRAQPLSDKHAPLVPETPTLYTTKMFINKVCISCYFQLDPIDVGISPELEGQVINLLNDLNIEPVPEVGQIQLGLYMGLCVARYVYVFCLVCKYSEFHL